MIPNPKTKRRVPHAPRPLEPAEPKSAPPAEIEAEIAEGTPHVPFLEDDSPSASEHGERAPAPHEDALLGTSSSHSAPPDTRAEEPYDELAPSPSPLRDQG